ncbi:MAG: hypothetical protein FJX54_05160 [Alphaproteobacteria bacterium]|nr:hypothetical protein [Alphaproteobacteria bacterium]
MSERSLIEGWPLLATLTAALAAIVLGDAAAHGFEAESTRAAIRVTARTSFVLFCLAYSAAALVRFWPNTWTRWQRRNRRQLGLAFAVSHLMHAAAIGAFALALPETFRQETSLGMFVAGGLGYLFILAMAATSFDRTAAAIGPRAWRWLHGFGAFYIWVGFVNGFGSRAMAKPGYWVFVAILLAVMALRLAAMRKKKVAAHA